MLISLQYHLLTDNLGTTNANAERTRLETRRSRRPASLPARPRPLPSVAHQNPDGRRIRRHSRLLGGSGKTPFSTPEHPRGNRQLHGRLQQNDGVRREDNGGTEHPRRSSVHVPEGETQGPQGRMGGAASDVGESAAVAVAVSELAVA